MVSRDSKIHNFSSSLFILLIIIRSGHIIIIIIIIIINLSTAYLIMNLEFMLISVCRVS